MSFFRNVLILGSFFYLHKILKEKDRENLDILIKEKLKKYDIAEDEWKKVLNLYSQDPQSIRSEPIDYQDKVDVNNSANTLEKTIDKIKKIPTQQIEADLNEVTNTVSNLIFVGNKKVSNEKTTITAKGMTKKTKKSKKGK